MSETLKERVREFWEREPCGTKTASSTSGTPEFFAEVERRRYELEPFIPEFAEFERWRDHDVLEIGVGLGTDFVRYVRSGARAVGVDLTAASVEAVQLRLEQEGLAADVRVADAESLPFTDASFDLVWCYGVLHHTPDTPRALIEVRRVLRPAGEARVMLYARHSWLAYGAWIRWSLLRGKPWRSIADVLATHLESPGTKAYTDEEVRALFAGFSSVEIRRIVTPYDRRVVWRIADLVGPRLGWFFAITAKP
jgi:SAM-dependent methyltransferase